MLEECPVVKVLMKYMEMMGQDTDFVTNLSKKLSPPLVTLLSSEPEVQLDSAVWFLWKQTVFAIRTPIFFPIQNNN